MDDKEWFKRRSEAKLGNVMQRIETSRAEQKQKNPAFFAERAQDTAPRPSTTVSHQKGVGGLKAVAQKVESTPTTNETVVSKPAIPLQPTVETASKPDSKKERRRRERFPMFIEKSLPPGDRE